MAFWNNLESFGSAPCVVGEFTLSYCEVAGLSDEIFLEDNSARKTRVARKVRPIALMVCGRDTATFVCYLSCLRSGIVPILLPEDMAEASVATYISQYKPQYLWCKKRQYSGYMTEKSSERHSLHDYLLFDTGFEAYDVDEQLAVLLTTSGTTADPKLVRLSYKNIQANADSIVECLDINERSKPITLLPFNYSFGLSVINSHVNSGAAIVFTAEGLTSRGFWDEFRQQEVTSFYGVPYHYEILKRFRFERLDFPSLSLMAQAGGRMPVAHKQEFYELSKTKGFTLVCMYGQTEATARITYLPADKFESKSHSVGIAIPGGVLSIDNPGEEGIGEVSYQGPNVSLGYATNIQDLALGDINQSRLMTGDLGYIDGEGFLFLTGRKKRYVKVFGHNVNLDHVESILSEMGVEAVVVGRDNLIKVLLINGQDKEIKKTLLRKTTIQPSALLIQGVDCLIYQPTGKVDYAMLTKRYIDNE